MVIASTGHLQFQTLCLPARQQHRAWQAEAAPATAACDLCHRQFSSVTEPAKPQPCKTQQPRHLTKPPKPPKSGWWWSVTPRLAKPQTLKLMKPSPSGHHGRRSLSAGRSARQQCWHSGAAAHPAAVHKHTSRMSSGPVSTTVFCPNTHKHVANSIEFYEKFAGTPSIKDFGSTSSHRVTPKCVSTELGGREVTHAT